MPLPPAPSPLSLLAPLALLLVGSAPTAQVDCGYAIEYGMNASFHTWSAREIVFADAMTRVKTFELWDTEYIGPAQLVPVGSGRLGEGWPDATQLAAGQSFRALIFGSMEGTIPQGVEKPYVLTWEGKGDVALGSIFVMGEANRTANRVEVTVDRDVMADNRALSVTWTSPDPSDPVRDIHCWLPGMEGTGRIFWPPYIDKVKAMNHGRGPSTWRTLDWSRVNEFGATGPGSFRFDLANVPTPASATQGTPRGVALEYQVAFCNEIGANLHLQLPHRTNDLTDWDYLIYLYETFRKVRDGSPAVPGVNGDLPFAPLRSDLKLSIELSNEIWNTGFPVSKWMQDEAARKGITVYEQIAGQIELVFDVADGVFYNDRAKQLRKYIGGSLATPNYLIQVMDSLRPGFDVDALGPAVYFGPSNTAVNAWLVDYDPSSGTCPNCPDKFGMIAAARAQIPDLRQGLIGHRVIANNHVNPDGSRPRLVLYEAGQNFKSFFQPFAPAANGAQLLPEMYAAYVDDLIPMLVTEQYDEVLWYSFMTDQNPALVPPFGVWNDMEQSITLPVPEVYVDEGAPKAAAIYRGPPLRSDCPEAQVGFRNAGTNVASYTSTPPRLGSELTLSVDLATTGHSLAVVFTFSGGPASIPLSGGQMLLAFGGVESSILLTGAPIARHSVLLPRDPSLAGQTLATQAIHLGSGKTYVLSNALDLTFGR